MKLWDKGYSLDQKIEQFTIGRDRELDLLLAPYDIEGTIAHVKMLASVGLLPEEDLPLLLQELEKIHKDAVEGHFEIEEGIEDVHSEVEMLLTRRLGDIGKKVHTARSRNDQVLVDLKLFSRAHIKETAGKVQTLFQVLLKRSSELQSVLMPGYTHLQVAMPSSFGLWFGAYAEALTDDMRLIAAAYEMANLNPLGSAAGYGSSAPISRQTTTKLLHFADLDYNSIYSQMNRGKMEWVVSMAYSSVALTIGKWAMDCCLFNSQNFSFVSLPKNMTTGSSIMPHKKNPDVFELMRAHCNKVASTAESIRAIISNLPSGYFRDLQLLKEVYLPLFEEVDTIIDIAAYAAEHLEVRRDIMSDKLYQPCFSVEEVNRLVSEGVPFRDAYRQVGEQIEKGEFTFKGELHHTHEGSIGNLCNDKIAEKMQRAAAIFA